MVVAGHETTVNGMGTMIYRLVSEPGLRERVLADRSLSARSSTRPCGCTRRSGTWAAPSPQETEVRGAPLCPGEKVMLVYGAANRDPERFAEPDRVRRRPPGISRHLTFGIGRHRCIGEPLAKLELRLTLEYVLDNLPDVEIDGDAACGAVAPTSTDSGRCRCASRPAAPDRLIAARHRAAPTRSGHACCPYPGGLR